MSIEIRPIGEDELRPFLRVMGDAFGFDVQDDPEKEAHLLAIHELQRSRCAFEGGQIVGTCSAFSLDLTVPGGSVRTGGTTVVATRPTHRRQGVGTAMIRAHLDDVRERGEPLAALWASEWPIYGRFGYGPAAFGLVASVDTPRAALKGATPRGTVRMLDGPATRDRVFDLHERLRRRRPGSFARSKTWWTHRRLVDRPEQRAGATLSRFAVYERAGEPVGWAEYRLEPKWEGGLADATLSVVELLAEDPEAEAALWRFLLGADLVSRVEWWNAPVDTPLPWLLEDGRRLLRRVTDSIWIRPVDLPAALEARRYAVDGAVTLEVVDRFCPWNAGRWRLEGGPGGATCVRTEASADLALDVSDLGSVYLGGTRLGELRRAGRVMGTEEAARAADRLLATDPLPWCSERF